MIGQEFCMLPATGEQGDKINRGIISKNKPVQRMLGRNMPIHFKEHLIVFTRYPEPGKTKTRLIPLLGAEGAADLQRKMTEHILSQVKRLSVRRELSVEIRYEGGDKNRMRTWLGRNFEYRPQSSGDLGQRMKCSLEDSFGAGRDYRQRYPGYDKWYHSKSV
jgi:hypothetical protein